MLENIYFLEQKICTAIICVSYESCEKCHRNSWDEESSCKYHYYKWNHSHISVLNDIHLYQLYLLLCSSHKLSSFNYSLMNCSCMRSPHPSYSSGILTYYKLPKINDFTCSSGTYMSAWTGLELTMLVVIITDCSGSYKSNYHAITTTKASFSCMNNTFQQRHNINSDQTNADCLLKNTTTKHLLLEQNIRQAWLLVFLPTKLITLNLFAKFTCQCIFSV
jgi:hypothetical protein